MLLQCPRTNIWLGGGECCSSGQPQANTGHKIAKSTSINADQSWSNLVKVGQMKWKVIWRDLRAWRRVIQRQKSFLRSSRQSSKLKGQWWRVSSRVRGLFKQANKVKQSSNWVKRSILLFGGGMQKMISNKFTSQDIFRLEGQKRDYFRARKWWKGHKSELKGQNEAWLESKLVEQGRSVKSL